MTHTPEQLAAMDALILKTIFIEEPILDGAGRCRVLRQAGYSYFEPTTDPAASDALEDKILSEMAGLKYDIYFQGNQYVIGWVLVSNGVRHSVSHPDKKICRVLFALKLFGEDK
jgi:hypothetical protein